MKSQAKVSFVKSAFPQKSYGLPADSQPAMMVPPILPDNHLQSVRLDISSNQVVLETRSRLQPRYRVLAAPTCLEVYLPGVYLPHPAIVRELGSAVRPISLERISLERLSDKMSRLRCEFSPRHRHPLAAVTLVPSANRCRWTIVFPESVATRWHVGPFDTANTRLAFEIFPQFVIDIQSRHPI